MVLAAVAVLALVALWWLTRMGEIFCVSVRNGRVLVVRGRVPGGLLSDFRAVVSAPPVERATIRGVKHEHAARLAISGINDEGREQRLRNVFRLYPISNLRKAPAIGKPTIGQLVGIAWLAWLFDRSFRE